MVPSPPTCTPKHSPHCTRETLAPWTQPVSPEGTEPPSNQRAWNGGGGTPTPESLGRDGGSWSPVSASSPGPVLPARPWPQASGPVLNGGPSPSHCPALAPPARKGGERRRDADHGLEFYWSFHKYVSLGSAADGGVACGGSALAGEPQSLKKPEEKRGIYRPADSEPPAAGPGAAGPEGLRRRGSVRHQPAKPTRPVLGPGSSQGTPGGGEGGPGWGAAPHPVQGPGHPGGPPCPAHPFPGSDFLSHSSSLLGRGPVPQGAEATSEPGRAEGRGCWALCGRFSLCGAQPGPCPPLANPWPMGPASQGRLVGSGPPWPCKSLLVGGQQVARGSVWRPRPSPRAGWAWTECPHGARPQSRTPPPSP